MVVWLKRRYPTAIAGVASSLIALVLALTLRDEFIVVGAVVALSYWLLAFALRPVIAMLGFIGRVLYWTIIAAGVLAVLGHVGRLLPAPWNALWGVELYLLGIIGVVALIGAVVAFITSARPAWAVLLLALTPLIEFLGLFVFGPWPHSALVFTGVAAAVLALVWHEPQRSHRLPEAAASA